MGLAIAPSHHPTVVLTVTEPTVHVSLWRTKLADWLFDIPMAEVQSIEVGPWDAASSSYGWRPTTGFLHGATHHAATSGLVFDLGAGDRVLFKLTGVPIELETTMAPLLALKPRP